MWDRIVRNWRTSSVAILASAAIVARWLGVIVTAEEILTVIIGFEALVLLFAKD